MKHLDGILNAVDVEFGAIEANGRFRSREEVENVYKLVDIAKDIYEIWKCEDEMDSGYSERGSRGMDGRYSNNYRTSYRRGYSRDDGKAEYIANLREMMETAPDENTRQSIQRMINQM